MMNNTLGSSRWYCDAAAPTRFPCQVETEVRVRFPQDSPVFWTRVSHMNSEFSP